jgi:hypothetical protein
VTRNCILMIVKYVELNTVHANHCIIQELHKTTESVVFTVMYNKNVRDLLLRHEGPKLQMESYLNKTVNVRIT